MDFNFGTSEGLAELWGYLQGVDRDEFSKKEMLLLVKALREKQKLIDELRLKLPKQEPDSVNEIENKRVIDT